MSEPAAPAGTLLVVGARGLGREIALHFARQRWSVACAARTRADLEALAREVESAGGQALPFPADLADRAQLAALVEETVGRFGRVDLVVAAQTSGARFASTPIEQITDDDFLRGFVGYPLGSLHLLQATAPQLRAQGAGTFVQIGTSSGLRVREGFAALACAQHALRALVQAAATELRRAGVHVAWLAVEGEIESARSQGYIARVGLERTLPAAEIVRSVEYLHRQERRAWSHELSLRPSAAEPA